MIDIHLTLYRMAALLASLYWGVAQYNMYTVPKELVALQPSAHTIFWRIYFATMAFCGSLAGWLLLEASGLRWPNTWVDLATYLIILMSLTGGLPTWIFNMQQALLTWISK